MGSNSVTDRTDIVVNQSCKTDFDPKSTPSDVTLCTVGPFDFAWVNIVLQRFRSSRNFSDISLSFFLRERSTHVFGGRLREAKVAGSPSWKGPRLCAALVVLADEPTPPPQPSHQKIVGPPI